MLDKAILVLDTVAAGPASLADLVARAGLPRATAHRLAVALETHRLLERDAEGRFVLGGRVRELAAEVADPLIAAAGPVLERLRDAADESAQLYRRDGAQRICIATAERAAGLRTTVLLGSRLPMSAGSGAQVLVAWSAEPERAWLLESAQFTARSLVDVRRRGWAESVGQREIGVASVSAPVIDERGDLLAAISISGPIDRVGRQPGRRYGALVARAAAELSAALAQR